MSNSFQEREATPRPVRFRIKDVPAMFSEGPEPDPPEQARFRWPEPKTLRRKLARSNPFWRPSLNA